MMTRQEYILAVLAAGDGDAHTPTQVQKLFFLLDRKVPQQVGGPWFAFEAGGFGPSDPALYEELQALGEQGLVLIVTQPSYRRTYWLTPAGRKEGLAQLEKLPPPAAEYIRQLSAWVRKLSFMELLAAICQEFPEMKERAIFQRTS